LGHPHKWKAGFIQAMDAPKYFYIDRSGKVVIDATRFQGARAFFDNLAAVYVAGSGWGFLNKSGELQIRPQFQESLDFSEGIAGVKVNGKWGFIDKKGQIVIDPLYDMVNSFSEGAAVTLKKNKILLIDKTNKSLFSLDTSEIDMNIQEDNAKYSEGLVNVYDRGRGRWGYMNRKGVFTIEPKFSNASLFSEGLAKVEVVESGEEKIGFINSSGEFVIPPLFNTDGDFRRNSTDFSEGLASLTEGLAPTVTKEAAFVYIDRTGRIILPTEFFYAGPFRDGLAVVFDESSGKWGYINKSGAMIIPLRFHLADSFSEGLACVALTNSTE